MMSDFRILVVSNSKKDSESAKKVLDDASLTTLTCESIRQTCNELAKGCGVIVIAKEMLTSSSIYQLNEAVSAQGKWSFLPIVVLVASGDLTENSEQALRLLKPLRNTTLLERPVRVRTFVSLIRSSLADRRRQYEVRDLLGQLEKTRAEAIDANRAKSDFLANISHEIRTPLGAILGFSELLVSSQVSRKQRWEYLQTMKRNGELLSALISDVLDLSKVESGKIDVEYVDTSIGELISEIVSVHQPKAGAKNISINVRYEVEENPLVRTDPLRLKQILNNLVGNAIKFTSEGYIDLVISERFEKEKRILSIQVKDSGIGMTDEQRIRLFKPFSQADSSITRKYGGTGLGLVLSKKLAQALGGDLTLVGTQIDQGTHFEVTIDISRDLENISSYHPNEKVVPVLSGCRILLVDDSKDNQMLISHFLGLANARVETADDGVEGVSKACNGNFDVILMDIQMPRLDGYQAIQSMRGKGYTKPIIALTACALKEDIDRCFDAGCDDYLTKPIHREKLVQTIFKYFERMQSNASDSSPASY